MSEKKPILMQGNEACAKGALAAGVRFFAGYPITPSSEIAEILSEELPKVGGRFIQMEDEIASMAAVIGASLTGSKAMTATSGPGMSLKSENLGYASMAEVPCVIVDVQRVGPSTGGPTAPSQGDIMQARWGTHGDHPIIALAPNSVKETYEVTIKAFNLSERFRTPVILLLDEVIGHMREKVVLPDQESIEIINRKKPTVPPEEYFPYEPDEDGVPKMASYGEGYRFHVTGLTHDKTGFPNLSPGNTDYVIRRLHEKIEKNIDEILMVEEYFMDDAELAVFAYGSPSRSSLSAVRKAREEGIKVGLIRPITIWPFPAETVKKAAQKVSKIIVPEMNLGQLLGEVERYAKSDAEVIGLNRVDGELITPQEVVDKIKEVL
ncbi:MAG: 2-oxoglutarate/2-oxoacid ferredoxin oxidoreductase subunit alpha [Thermosediminibacterales bacterium]|nr:2-oxoglutarate/2-oxoacid ferredoxin oxidoreductase subunit alpha [Thermosediminibacterales bacterium]MDK2836847.1 2-oxoglutarate/2-oxoacid ferredoxin oxidoreductase subunit alpha [Thermosediminibacterales bacterium]